MLNFFFCNKHTYIELSKKNSDFNFFITNETALLEVYCSPRGAHHLVGREYNMHRNKYHKKPETVTQREELREKIP